MNSGSNISGKHTATTRGSEAPKNPASELSEAQYLEQQAAEARQAMTQTLRSIGESLGRGADPRVWTRKHPLVLLGGAAVAGFVTIRILERPRKPPEPATSDNHINGKSVDAGAQQPARARRRKGLSRHLIRYAIRLLQPVITGFVMSQIRPADDQTAAQEPGAQYPDPGAEQPAEDVEG